MEESTPLSGSGCGPGSGLCSGRRLGPLGSLRMPLKRSLRSEMLERLPGWYSPARKRLKSCPDGVAHGESSSSSPCSSQPSSPRLEPISNDPQAAGPAGISWSVLSAQRRAARGSPAPSTASSTASSATPSTVPNNNPSQWQPEADSGGQREDQDTLCVQEAPQYDANEVVAAGAENQVTGCRADLSQNEVQDKAVGSTQCKLAPLDVPEPDVSVMERLVAPTAYPEVSRVLDLEDDLQLLVMSPPDPDSEERRPRGPCLRPRPAPSICLRTGRLQSLQQRRDSLTTTFLTMTTGLRFPSKKSFVAWLWRLRPPYFIILMGLVQVSVYTIPKATQVPELTYYLVWRNSRIHQPWRMLTYALLHSDLMHLTLNVGVQSIVAMALEKEQGPLRVAGVYVGGVVAGALSTAVTSPYINLVGASAGVYAILMSHLAHIILNSNIRNRWTRVSAILLCVGADFGHTLYHALLEGNASPQIGVSAHCSGAVSGVLLGLAAYRSAAMGVLSKPRVLWVTRISSFCLYILPALCTIVWIVSKPLATKSSTRDF